MNAMQPSLSILIALSLSAFASLQAEHPVFESGIAQMPAGQNLEASQKLDQLVFKKQDELGIKREFTARSVNELFWVVGVFTVI